MAKKLWFKYSWNTVLRKGGGETKQIKFYGPWKEVSVPIYGGTVLQTIIFFGIFIAFHF